MLQETPERSGLELRAGLFIERHGRKLLFLAAKGTQDFQTLAQIG
jgi:hypothetical protein